MEKSKFLKVLISLDSEQFYKLEFFLKYMEEARPKCVEFYAIIKENYISAKENWNVIILDKESIHLQLFKRPFTTQSSSLRELSSEFYKHLKNYCAYIQFEKEKQYYYLKYLNEKGINELFEKYYIKMLNENNTKNGLVHLWRNIELNELYSEYEVNNELTRKIDIENIFNEFNNFSAIKNLQLYCVLLQKSISRNYIINKNILNQITLLQQNKTIQPKNKLIYKLYENSINMLCESDISYQLFKKMLYDHIHIISKQELYILFSSLLSFCNKQIQNKNDREAQFFWSELLFNYFYMYEEGLLNDGAYVPIMHIKNICVLSIRRMKEKEPLKFSKSDVISILQESKTKTIPQYRESVYNYNMGKFHLSQSQYEEATKVFETKTKYANQFFVYEVKLHLLECYFLLNKNEKFEKTLAAFKELMRRDQFLSKPNRESYKKILKVFSILRKIRDNIQYKYRYKPESDINKLNNYLKDIPLDLSKWFEEQISELKK